MSLIKCEDIPECEENVDTCVKSLHEDTTSYPEALEEPFCSNSSDIATLNRCNLQASCQNTPGSFICTCNYPYIGSGTSGTGTGCNYPRECATGNHDCPKQDYYDNLPGTTFDAPAVECVEQTFFYSCQCATGFFPLPDGMTCDTYDFAPYFDVGQGDDYKSATNPDGLKELWCDDFNYTIGGDVINNVTVTNVTTVYYACIDQDECSAAYVSMCGPNSMCTNTVGSHICQCLDGFDGDGRVDGSSCSDINECETGAHFCPTADNSARCQNTEGSYECYCLDGYKDNSTAQNGTECIDCDECSLGTHGCDANANCTNNIGSYSCECNVGFSGSGIAGDCQDDDECALQTDDCHDFAACSNNFGSFVCLCMQGFVGTGRNNNASRPGCVDEDECDTGSHNCNGLAVCTNLDGSFQCECTDGYLGDGVNHTDCSPEGYCCKDFDECADAVNICGLLATCNNNNGSYTCDCNEPGYRLSDNAFDCEDIDECDALDCATYGGCADCDDTLGVCTNTAGNYTCECLKGYNGTGYGQSSCSEINECDFPGLFTCQFNATCVDLLYNDGGYRCDCNQGFTAVAQYCRDIDECAADPNLCDTNADCINTEGAYECTCKNGWTGSGAPGDCNNVDECSDSSLNECHVNATCTDNPGSYDCECLQLTNANFFGNGEQCYDIDECQTSDHNCCVTAGCYCTNGFGYHTCGCEDGYDGDGFKSTFFSGSECTNTNECSDGGHNCDTANNATCTDNTGGFSCSCPSGYDGNGVLVADGGTSCTDIDECRFCEGGSSPDPANCLCNANADCTNEPNTFSCECKDGYVGDGITCIDTNECAEETHDCHVEASCVNEEPGFRTDSEKI